jgi:hypothetical protein
MTMYVFKHTTTQPWNGHTSSHSSTLLEMTRAELTEAMASANDRVDYEHVSADRARAWVLDGGHHGTPLYIDISESGARRVRYARDA